jgi:hypothetical protein
LDKISQFGTPQFYEILAEKFGLKFRQKNFKQQKKDDTFMKKPHFQHLITATNMKIDL